MLAAVVRRCRCGSARKTPLHPERYYPHARIRVFHHSGLEIPGSAREGKPRSFSYARDKTTDQAAPDCPRGTQCLNVRIAAAIGEPGPAKRAVATGCSTPSVLTARQRTVSHFTASTKPITGQLKRPVEADAESSQELL